MDHVNAGRVLMGDSLGFHIIFVMLGIALPLFTLFIEYWAIRRKSAELMKTAKLWSYIASVLVVTGVISGTVVALQMFFVWPGILQFGGKVIGVGFMLEGYAFLIEAIALAFYVATWNKIKGYKHIFIGAFIPLGAALSGVLITAVNAWMNHPTGFEMINGVVSNPKPFTALFNQTTFLEVTHSMFAYYGSVALLIAGIYSYTLLRKKSVSKTKADTAHFIISRMAVIAVICMLVVGYLGDRSAVYLAEKEPVKLAAMEILDTTQDNAPFRFGGKLDKETGVSNGGLTFDGGLSWLAKGSTDAEVKGLDSVDKQFWPPLVVHTLFDIKLALIPLLLIVPLVFLGLYKKAKAKAFSKPMLIAMMVTGLAGIVVTELGWMLTEIGRQPWAVTGHVLTKDAFTTSPGVQALGFLFPTVFVILFVLTYIALRKTISSFNARKDSK
jgi:cytochrome d ubiquinol oxidase subunit I